MDKHKLFSYILTGLLIAVSAVLCVFIFFITPPFTWLTSALFVVESVIYMALALLRKSQHYKMEFYTSLATAVCFAVMTVLEII